MVALQGAIYRYDLALEGNDCTTSQASFPHLLYWGICQAGERGDQAADGGSRKSRIILDKVRGPGEVCTCVCACGVCGRRCASRTEVFLAQARGKPV